MFVIIFDPELKSMGKKSAMLWKNGRDRICLVINDVTNTTVHITTSKREPANVKSWFIMGLGGASVLKIKEKPCSIERKSFLAIHIIKKIRTMFTIEREMPGKTPFANSLKSNSGYRFSTISAITSRISGEACKISKKVVKIISKIGINEKINPKVQADAAASSLFCI